MNQKAQSDITPEDLDKRLDEIFGGGGGQDDSSGEQSWLSQLESIVLTLDWEISDETVRSFLAEVESLRTSSGVDKVQENFLKILHAVGKYVQRRKGQAEPEAINLLQTVFADLKKVVETEDLSRKEKKEMLLKDIEQYNALKSKISKRRSSGEEEIGEQETAESPRGEAQDQGSPDSEERKDTGAGRSTEFRKEERAIEEQLPSSSSRSEHSEEKSVLQAVEELKGVIREEFRKLREDLGVGNRE